MLKFTGSGYSFGVSGTAEDFGIDKAYLEARRKELEPLWEMCRAARKTQEQLFVKCLLEKSS